MFVACSISVQADDLIFFTMEYIDGEDLGSLLRRIGRLPGDKAAEIARKICAGVAAAHDKGVLHRDLKPANVMLDGRGEVLITDFGLAGIAHEIDDIRSGTPAYMAPEQLAGEEVTVKSDIYSLGLLLYEVFTGKAAFDGRTLEEIVRVRRDRNPSRPSALVKDLDPAVEHVILHCLEADPAARPASALAVAAALPGGDPLAAALAAGETPSPQMVAAAGETTGLKLPLALGALSVAIVGLLAFYLLAAKTSGIARINVPYSAEILNQKARDIVQQMGYTAPPADSADGFLYNDAYLEYLHDNPKLRSSWDAALRGRPPALIYWLRESPSEMVATEAKDNSLVPGIVDRDDPPPILSGMVQISLDSQGRLYHLEAMPPEKETSSAPFAPFNWNVLFQSAGLNQAQFQPATSTWNSLAASDARAAWTGTWPGTTYPLRVEAAAYRGKPVYFALIGDWTEPKRMENSNQSFTMKVMTVVLSVLALLLLLVAVLIARRNWVREKADVQGAWRLGIVIFSTPDGAVALSGAFCPFYLLTRTFRAGRERRSFHYRRYLRAIPGHRTFHPAALAARHHLLEPPYGGTGARPSGRQRYALRRAPGYELGTHLLHLLSAAHASGRCAGIGYHRLSDGSAPCNRLLAVASRDFGAGNTALLFCDVRIARHSAQALAGCSGLCRRMDSHQGSRKSPRVD